MIDNTPPGKRVCSPVVTGAMMSSLSSHLSITGLATDRLPAHGHDAHCCVPAITGIASGLAT